MEWINVKDKYPNVENEKIIVLFSNNCIETIFIKDWNSYCLYNKEQPSTLLTDLYEDSGIYITHWMRLPELPKN